jgi:hypothetical protein
LRNGSFIVSLLGLVLASGQQSFAATIGQGKIILGGNEIAPPYAIVTTNSAIYANGYRLFPAIPRVNHHSEPPHPTSAGFGYRHHEIREEVGAYLAARSKAPGAAASASQEIADRYNSYPEVERAWWASPRQFLIKWRDMHEPEEMLITGSAHPASRRSIILGTCATIEHTLALGGMVLVGDGYTVFIPPNRVAETVQALTLLRSGKRTNKNESPYEGLGLGRDLRFPQALDSLRAVSK